ncbi:twin transmembrane helix small protein [Propylenella binzhouense]|uniref:Twin transmembrane helix small protein n=1 Tax=Propylenella binzhouense TaxID=2555902 RepID=A0A964T4B8_9HYPH|nr:twin transmembrane helix small protein [Propylenella binzhouense]MYZ48256.1 twin transmembrane helix small protein [Propylenella binzhouense]
MSSLFQVITPIAMAIVVLILLLGLWNMMRGGSPSTSQKLMRARVVMQFVAIVLAMTALWFMGR